MKAAAEAKENSLGMNRPLDSIFWAVSQHFSAIVLEILSGIDVRSQMVSEACFF